MRLIWVVNGTCDTWRNLRHKLDRMLVVIVETDRGRVAQRTATTHRQHPPPGRGPGRSRSRTRPGSSRIRTFAPVLPAQMLRL